MVARGGRAWWRAGNGQMSCPCGAARQVASVQVDASVVACLMSGSCGAARQVASVQVADNAVAYNALLVAEVKVGTNYC